MEDCLCGGRGWYEGDGGDKYCDCTAGKLCRANAQLREAHEQLQKAMHELEVLPGLTEGLRVALHRTGLERDDYMHTLEKLANRGNEVALAVLASWRSRRH